jgi:hypothetical protein
MATGPALCVLAAVGVRVFSRRFWLFLPFFVLAGCAGWSVPEVVAATGAGLSVVDSLLDSVRPYMSEADYAQFSLQVSRTQSVVGALSEAVQTLFALAQPQPSGWSGGEVGAVGGIAGLAGIALRQVVPRRTPDAATA